MASKPVITHTTILAMAGQHIRDEIIRQRNKIGKLRAMTKTLGPNKNFDRLEGEVNRQVGEQVEMLGAIEEMYLIETGAELGYLDGLVGEAELVRCKDCEFLMFSDCYGECRIGNRGIVRPDDCCAYGKRREEAQDGSPMV